jgi:hypothetical protein
MFFFTVMDFFDDRTDRSVRNRKRDRVARGEPCRAPYYFTISPRDGIAERELA